MKKEDKISADKLKQFSNVQPISHFIVLMLATYGLYFFYWFYRNWKQFKLHQKLEIKPGWLTVGVFIPIVNVILLYRQFKYIRGSAESRGVKKLYSPGWVLFGYLFLNAMGAKLSDPFWLLGFFSIWPIAIVQGVLNSYWKIEQPNLPSKKRFSSKEIILLIIGAILWSLILMGFFLPE